MGAVHQIPQADSSVVNDALLSFIIHDIYTRNLFYVKYKTWISERYFKSHPTMSDRLPKCRDSHYKDRFIFIMLIHILLRQ